MTDIIDQAQQFEALNFTQALQVQAARARNTVRPTPLGHCLNDDCCEPFKQPSDRLFCGPACAERFDSIQKLRR